MKLEPMADFFAARADGYDEHMMRDIDGAAEFYPSTAALLPKSPGTTILDLGIGTGLELEPYYLGGGKADVTGIDLSDVMLGKLLRKFPGKNIQVIQGSFFDVPFGENRWNAVVSVESLHHFTPEQKSSLYRKIWNALKSKGCFVLTDYFAESREAEQQYFADLARLKAEQGVDADVSCHWDTPLTLSHEIDLLKGAGFQTVMIMDSWGSTCTLLAGKATPGTGL